MNHKEFVNVIKNKELRSVYLIYGEEEYLIDRILKTIRESCVERSLESINYIVLDGKEIIYDAIINACETLPFMAEKRFVVIKDFPLFKNKKDDEPTIEDKVIDEWKSPPSKSPLVKYIGKLGDHLCLIFVEKHSAIRKSNALYKAINKYGGIVDCKKLKGNDLDKWIKDRFKINNNKISKANIYYLVQQIAYFDSKRNKSLYDLENEINKLSNYLGVGQEVTKKTIDLLIAKPLEMNVFNLLNSISQKDSRKALQLFNEMYISNEPVLFILHMVVRQLRNMLKYKLLAYSRCSTEDVYSGMNLSEYEYMKVSEQSNNFSIPQLEKAMNYCLQTDRSLKYNYMEDRTALEMLIINLCTV